MSYVRALLNKMVTFGCVDCLPFDKRGIRKGAEGKVKGVRVCVLCLRGIAVAEQSDNEGEKKKARLRGTFCQP